MKLKNRLAKLASFLVVLCMLITCVPNSLTSVMADEMDENAWEEITEAGDVYDEIGLNEDTLVFTGSANDVDVEVTAFPGTFPIGTQMKVETVNKEDVIDAVEEAMTDSDAAVNDLRAVDITFVDEEGNEVQPEYSVEVNLTTEAFSAETISVVHMVEEEKAEVVEDVSISEDKAEAVFDADHFSVYVVVDTDVENPDLNAVATYEFYVGEELKQTQYIKTGDTLLDPGPLGAENGASQVFKGWYVGETPLTFGEKTVSQTETIKVEAKIETTYYVTFYGEKDADAGRGIASVKTVTVEGPAGTEGTLDISNESIVPKADTSVFEGWAESDSSTTVLTNTTITVSGNKELYAVVSMANWIHFDENVTYPADSDPTYTGPVYVKQTDALSTKKPADPTRQGYTFGGWYTEAACTNAFAWEGTGLEADITLFAKWIPGKSGYTVVIWKQKVTDNKTAADATKTYDFESSTGIGDDDDEDVKTGDDLSEVDFDSYKEYNFTGFHFGRIEITPSSTVRADGTTVVNVYYDRDLLTIYFFDGETQQTYVEATDSDNDAQQYALIDGEYVALTRRETAGSYYWAIPTPTEYTGTRYREATGNTGTQYGFSGGQMVRITPRDGGCGGVYWELPNGTRYDGDRYFEGTNSDTGFGVVNGQVVGIFRDDEGWKYNAETEWTGTRYVNKTVPDDDHIFTGLYGSSLASNGYTWPSDRAWYQNRTGPGTRLTFLDAFKFNGLDGVSNGNKLLTQYGRALSGNSPIRFYKQAIDKSWPATPANTVYTSGGDFTVTEKYEGFKAAYYSHGTGAYSDIIAGETTSGANLNLRFERLEFSLTFVDPTDGKTLGTQNNIPYEDSMSKYKIADPVKDHYTFLGWYEDNAGVASFNWNSTMPAANKVLYAKWQVKEYNVTLDVNGGHIKEGSTQSTDFNVPYGTELSKDSLFQCVEYDSKHEFVGWFYKDGPKAGSVYDYGKVEGPVHLIAKWRMPGQVSIVYEPGEGGSGVPTDTYKYATDSAVVLGAPPTTINEGYSFVGWKLKDKAGNVLDTIYYVNNTFDIKEDLIADYDEATKTGTVKIIAVYNKTNEGPFEKTYIRWFKNDGTACFHVDTLDNPAGDVSGSTLLVNKPVAIQAAPTREGYTFLGWAKVDDTGASISLTQDLDEDDILIYYKDNKFYSDEACTNVVTQVAADNDKKYEAVFAVWKLDPIEVTVTITGNKDTVPYNGEEQQVEGYDVTINGSDLYKESDFTFSGEAIAKGTEIDYYPMGLAEDQFTNINDNFTVTFEVTDGGLTIVEPDAKIVTITADDITIDYGDEEPELTATGEGFDEGDDIDSVEFEISRQEGTKPGTYVITVTGETEQDPYVLKFVNGKFTILAGEYEFTKGDGQTWMKGSKKTADFEVTRKTHDERAFKFYQDIEIDGVKVDKSQYTYKEGCVELYISAEYMETLKVGDHTIKAIFEDGTAEAKFKVAEEKKEDKGPETGDHNNVVLWASLMGAALLAIATTLVLRKRSKNR